MNEQRTADDERERCLAILEAHKEAGIDGRLYVRLWNLINNPDHDPRAISDEELPLMGYKPAARKKARHPK